MDHLWHLKSGLTGVGTILAAGLSIQAQLVLSVGPDADTFISSRDPNNNAGAHTHLAAGRDGSGGGNPRRGLMRFDLSGIPAGSTIESVALRLRVVIQPRFGDVDSDFLLHRMVLDWGEGAKTGNNGAAAGVGEATWNQAFQGQTPWTAAGAQGDFVALDSASQFVTGLAEYTWGGAGLAADVQHWLDVPASNHGWLLKSDAEGSSRSARAFGSRENPASSARPLLTVTYTPPDPPVPPRLTDITLSSQQVSLTFTSETNQLYDIETVGALSATSNWMVAEANVPGDPTGTNQIHQLPFLATPAYSNNQALAYRVQTRTHTHVPLLLQLEPSVTGLVAPTVLTHAGDGSGRRFIAEQTGQILILDATDTLLPTPFLDLSARMTNLTTLTIGGNTDPGLNGFYDERGLLGLAFHPGYPTNGLFYVYYSTDGQTAGQDHRTVLSEFSVSMVDSNAADPASERILLQLDQPEFNHNGGAVVFGPDGYLYLGFGDGGGGGDQHPPIGNGQQPTTLLGSIIRIDVDGGPPFGIPADNPFAEAGNGHPAVYAYGFRNPWRMSFDRGGERHLFAADVGQNEWEEINIVRRQGNYGWRVMEASRPFDLPLAGLLNLDVGALDYPIHEYRHGPLGISIIGGFVYRGAAYPELDGRYVFGDFSTSFGAADGAVYYLEETRPGIWQRFEFVLDAGGRLGRYVKGFGEDEEGELYLLTSLSLGPAGSAGEILKLAKP